MGMKILIDICAYFIFFANVVRHYHHTTFLLHNAKSQWKRLKGFPIPPTGHLLVQPKAQQLAPWPQRVFNPLSGTAISSTLVAKV
jgi:hypothetical protein